MLKLVPEQNDSVVFRRTYIGRCKIGECGRDGLLNFSYARMCSSSNFLMNLLKNLLRLYSFRFCLAASFAGEFFKRALDAQSTIKFNSGSLSCSRYISFNEVAHPSEYVISQVLVSCLVVLILTDSCSTEANSAWFRHAVRLFKTPQALSRSGFDAKQQSRSLHRVG